MDPLRDEIVKSLLDSYAEIGGINHLDAANLPSQAAIATICDDLLQLLFPGFFSSEVVASKDLPALTAAKVDSLRERLCAELRRSLRFKHGDTKDHRTESGNLCRDFFRKLP